MDRIPWAYKRKESKGPNSNITSPKHVDGYTEHQA